MSRRDSEVRVKAAAHFLHLILQRVLSMVRVHGLLSMAKTRAHRGWGPGVCKGT